MLTAFISPLWQAGLSQIPLSSKLSGSWETPPGRTSRTGTRPSLSARSKLQVPGHPASWSSSNSAGAGRTSHGHHTRTRDKMSPAKGFKSCSCCWHRAPTELRTQHDQGARALKQLSTPTEYIFQWEEQAVLRGNNFPVRTLQMFMPAPVQIRIASTEMQRVKVISATG